MSRDGIVGEDRLLAWLRSRYNLPLVGDDGATLRLEHPFVVTTDSQIEGVHFPPRLDPNFVARRLLAVNLSDLAAMGADPRYAFLALAAPAGFAHRRFFRSLLAACGESGVELAGGDLAHDPHHFHAVLTLVGTLPSKGRWLRRDGARPGHRIWLGGTVGESAAGQRIAAQPREHWRRLVLPPGWEMAPKTLRTAALHALRRHLLPQPQLALGRWLGRRKEAGALDVSDGVARDLHRLCRASRCGASIDAATLPWAPGFRELCEWLGCDALELSLFGGEDYVLLFTLPERVTPPPEMGCIPIGTIEAQEGVRLRSGSAVRRLPAKGWDHLAMRREHS